MSRYGPNGGFMGPRVDLNGVTFHGGIFPLSKQQQVRGSADPAKSAWPNSPFSSDYLVVGGGGSAG